MKKRTNLEICEDVVKKTWAINNVINDIHLIKRQAMQLKLQGEIKEVIIKVINIYNNQLVEIEEKNWPNWESKGVKYLFRTFKKAYLLNFDESITDDLTVLSEYQNELLTAMDKIHQMRSEKAEKTENNQNDVQVTCDTLHNWEWVHTTYQTAQSKIIALMTELTLNKNVKNIGKPEEIPTKEYQYTYKFRGCGPGCQPKDFTRTENVPGFKFEVLIYDRKLSEKEIKEYELTALN